MKRLIVYYSLSGNTEDAVRIIAESLGCDMMKVDTVKPMPKSFAAQILVGGGQVAMNIVPKIRPIDRDLNQYDEIFIGTPIWNSRGVPAINAFLQDEAVCGKVTGLIITSGGGDAEKCIRGLESKTPNVKFRVSLLDRKHKEYGRNGEKIREFVQTVKEWDSLRG